MSDDGVTPIAAVRKITDRAGAESAARFIRSTKKLLSEMEQELHDWMEIDDDVPIVVGDYQYGWHDQTSTHWDKEEVESLLYDGGAELEEVNRCFRLVKKDVEHLCKERLHNPDLYHDINRRGAKKVERKLSWRKVKKEKRDD